jgi:hypothetical protein
MSEMNEYTPELFELIDAEGNKKNFELIDAAELNGEQYFAMVPAIEDEDFLNSDCDLVILKSIFEDGEEILTSIDDDEEFMQVSEFFLQRMEEAMEYVDDEEFEEYIETDDVADNFIIEDAEDEEDDDMFGDVYEDEFSDFADED